MKKRFLRLKTALRAVMLILMMGVVGVTEGFAAYDFSAVCSTGQTLYYRITDAENHYVELTYPGSSGSYWSGFAEPHGNMTIPTTVTYNDVVYSVKNIGNYAFYICLDLTSVVVPNSVTNIGYEAFYDCYSVESLTIGNSVTSIGNRAFSDCEFLNHITIFAETPPTLGSYVFYNVDNIPVTVPCGSYSAYNDISWGGFTSFQEECPYITFADNNVKTLCVANWDTSGDGELSYDEAAAVTDLDDVFKFNKTITSFDEFQYFTGLTEISTQSFGECTNLTSITLPNSVETIGDYAFYMCTGLTSLTMPNSVTIIGVGAFSDCRNINTITLSNSLTEIGQTAFGSCNSITSITIPASVTSIGNSAFQACTGLTRVYYTGNIMQWCNISFGNETSNPIYQSKNLYINNTLVVNLVIPETVTEIKDCSFIRCRSITSLTIPNTVTSIGDYAFNGCSGLTTLTIPNSVESIGNSAFRDCSNLTTLSLGNSLESIGSFAFYIFSCKIISMTVNAITPPTLGSYVFYTVNKSIPVTVPCGSLSAYQSASGWSDFTNYQCMGSTSITGYGSSTDSDHWVFIASPLASSVLPTAVDGLVADPEENYDLYRFNQSGENGEWENYKGHTAGFVLENGKGYLYANKNNVTLTFAGTMNMTASQEVELDYDGTANMSGWNLVGNPFTEAAHIDRPYYKMNATGTDVTPVETYGATPVAAYSGIVVHAETSGESVTFTKSGSKSSDNGGLQITLSKAGVRGDEAQDKVIVSFNKYAQLSKFIFNEDNAKLYIPIGGEDYAIAYSDRQSNMPLYFKTKEMGIYTMNFEGAIDNIKIIDNLDGSVIDLDAEKSFTFVGTPSDRNDRFTIAFNTPSTDDFAYQSGDGIVVNGEGELQVFDIMGRMVAKYYVNGVETVYIPCQSGVYVLRLLGKETKTQKIVVK